MSQEDSSHPIPSPTHPSPNALQLLRNQLNSFNPTSDYHNMFKEALSIHINAEPQPHNLVCVENVLQDLDVDFVFNIETLKGVRTLHRILYQYLEINGVQFDTEINGK